MSLAEMGSHDYQVGRKVGRCTSLPLWPIFLSGRTPVISRDYRPKWENASGGRIQSQTKNVGHSGRTR